MSRVDKIEVDGGSMDVYVAEPAGDGPHPAMLLTFHRGGMDDFTRERADRLAEAGYVAVAPDFYHRRPDGEDSLESVTHRLDVDVLNDINATVAHLQGFDNTDSERIGIVGHCMGGRVSLVGASANPAFKACVVYYGGNMFGGWGDGMPTAFDRLKDISCPVIGFYGNDDSNPSPEHVDQIDSEMTAHGIEHEFHRYDGAGHAFQNHTSEKSYRPEATKISWARMLEFLAEKLG
ncbi:MAG: dienelactone hydrolase family protein [Alphaproteobacteria bacterium]